MNTTQCEVCQKDATKCCSSLDQPPLHFCDRHYKEHVRDAHRGQEIGGR